MIEGIGAEFSLLQELEVFHIQFALKDMEGVILRKIIRTWLLASLILALSFGGSQAYDFGSKVMAGNTDVGLLLEDFAVGQQPILGYWDIGPNPGMYDSGDVVYLDFPPTRLVTSNDLRLTPFSPHLAGTKVTANDNDMGQPLAANPWTAGARIWYADLYGIAGQYDIDDPVYLKGTGDTTTNDIRLTTINGLCAGSKVMNFHPDFNTPVNAMVSWPVPPAGAGSFATIRFNNANGNVNGLGNPVYDYPDDLYIDISVNIPTAGLGNFGFVVPNCVRLSAGA